MGDARSEMHSMLFIVSWKQLDIIIGEFISYNSILPRPLDWTLHQAYCDVLPAVCGTIHQQALEKVLPEEAGSSR